MSQYHNTSLNIWKWSNTKSHKWHRILICTTTTTTTTTHEFRGQRSSIPFLSTPSCLAAPWCLTSSYRFCLKIRDHGLLVPSFGVEFHRPKKKESDHSMGFFLFVGRVPKINFYMNTRDTYYILLWNQKWAKSHLHPWKRRPTNWKPKHWKSDCRVSKFLLEGNVLRSPAV